MVQADGLQQSRANAAGAQLDSSPAAESRALTRIFDGSCSKEATSGQSSDAIPQRPACVDPAVRGGAKAGHQTESAPSVMLSDIGTTAWWGVCALVVCGAALQLVRLDLTFPNMLSDWQREEVGLFAGIAWLSVQGVSKWLPLVLPAGLAARWLLPEATSQGRPDPSDARTAAGGGPAVGLSKVQLAGRCLMVLATAAFLTAGAGHGAGTLIMDCLMEVFLAAVALVLRPGNPGPLLSSMRQCVCPVLDCAAARVWCALSPLLGLAAAFALMIAMCVVPSDEDRSKASQSALKTSARTTASSLELG